MNIGVDAGATSSRAVMMKTSNGRKVILTETLSDPLGHVQHLLHTEDDKVFCL